ncbi:MAG: hypothetical protein ABI681_01770 [Gemmatimonadales bacterium]
MTEPIAASPAVNDVDARDTIVVATSIAAFVLAAIYWVSRIGFVNPAAPVLQSLGLSLFICCTPLQLMRLIRRKGDGEWLSSQPALTVLALVVSAFAGVLAGATGFNIAAVLSAAGFASSIWTGARWLRRGKAAHSLAFLAGTVAFAVWTGGVVWGSRYKMPLFWETFSLKANIHHDPMYIASMANMLATYGTPSIGLDGVPLAHYHYGSGWLFIQWANLIGTDALSFYSLGYPVVVIPLFFGAVLLLGAELRERMGGSSDVPPLRSDYRDWIVFLAATIGVIPTRALDGLAIWNANVLISESYLAGMPVFLLVLASGLALERSTRQRARVAFLLGFLPLALVACGFLKISLMLLLLGVVLYLAVRLHFWRSWIASVSVVLCVAATALTYPIVSLPAQNSGISPLNFMRYDVADGWQQFFPLLHMMWTWIYIAARLWEEKVRDVTDLRTALRAKRLMDAEVLFLLMLLGFIPGELISIHGGSAVYFSDVQRWVALAFIIGRIGVWAERWRADRAARPAASVRTEDGGVRAVRLSTLLAIFVIAPFVVTLLANSVQWPLWVVRANIALRRELVALSGTRSAGLSALTDPRTLSEGLRRTQYYGLVSSLRDIRALPIEERQRAVLFIPQSYRLYWTMWDADGRCTYTPLVAPAVSSVALIDGTPSYGCTQTNQYNMTAYRPRAGPQLPSDTTDAALCARARMKGFAEVIVLGSGDASAPRRRRIDCYLPGR